MQTFIIYLVVFMLIMGVIYAVIAGVSATSVRKAIDQYNNLITEEKTMLATADEIENDFIGKSYDKETYGKIKEKFKKLNDYIDEVSERLISMKRLIEKKNIKRFRFKYNQVLQNFEQFNKIAEQLDELQKEEKRTFTYDEIMEKCGYPEEKRLQRQGQSIFFNGCSTKSELDVRYENLKKIYESSSRDRDTYKQIQMEYKNIINKNKPE